MDELIEALGQSQALLLALVEDTDETTYRRQYHPDLSPLGWHLGHCVYNECFWLHEKVRGDSSVTAPIEDFYTPPRTPKAERGARLPARTDLLVWAQEIQAFNLHYLHNLRPEWRAHPLLKDDYLLHFLLQHNSQHYETMLMILTQKSLAEYNPDALAPQQPLQAAPLHRDSIDIPAGHYRIGGERPTACDNELPRQQAELGPFAIARQPVSNAEYLAFMESGGYRDDSLWSAEGDAWLHSSQASHPDHWRQTAAGGWHAVGVHGAYDLAPGEPVSGINHYEASAFARWAEAQLPHEYQWEAACRIGALEHTGRAWEWCRNTFQPYDGFTPFPYNEYSQPWFDERHYSLKGGSLYTRPAVKRVSFRNFFEADKRHVFAGLRLVY
jgi:ergothioneine biosynthesis protein EgtB